MTFPVSWCGLNMQNREMMLWCCTGLFMKFPKVVIWTLLISYIAIVASIL